MYRYVLGRIISIIPTLFVLSLVVFIMVHMAPGDPASIMLGNYATKDEIEAFRIEMGFDRPLYIQYGLWLGRAVQGNLGQSINSNLPVRRLIAERIPVTMSLAILAVGISMLIALPLGVIAGVRQNTVYDQIAMSFCLLGLSVPDFVTGLLLILVVAVDLNWLPSMGYAALATGFYPWLKHLIMPSFALGFLMTAVTARMTRSSVVDVLRQDYVLTARAKGLREVWVISIHVLKNSLIPVVTVIGMNFGAVFRGAVVIETLFSLPGIGRLMITGIQFRDYPVIQGCFLVIVLAYVLINLIVDLVYAWLDPRIHYA